MYSTKINGEVLEFGTSGLLYRSNKLMYDRATETLWRQFTGEPVVGTLVDSGIKLEVLPVLLTTWGDWLATHPDTTVLDADTGLYPAGLYVPEWDPQSIYYGLRQQPESSFPVWDKSGRLPEKSQILGLIVNGEAKAYPVDTLHQQPVLNDILGGRALVVITPGDRAGSRAYQRDGQRFTTISLGGRDAAEVFVADQGGEEWRMEEDALVNVNNPSHRLDRLPSQIAYWFGWYTFNNATGIYGQE
ncbi:MAG: DUF3179 domain-containing protein [Chloroflexi bacterium]|nr:DUF3179 domain-containing protein [Chloroflexota bacterium]